MSGRQRVIAGLLLLLAPVALGPSGATSGLTATANDLVADDEFGVGGLVTFPPTTYGTQVVPLADGRLLVAVEHRPPTGVGNESGIVRLLANGSIDTTFATATSNRLDAVGNVFARRDGRFLVGVTQYLPDGQLDTAWGDNGEIAGAGQLREVFETSTGQLMLIRNNPVSPNACALIRVTTAGDMEPASPLNAGCVTNGTTQLPDGRTAVLYSTPQSSGFLVIVRPDGSLDPSGPTAIDVEGEFPWIESVAADATRIYIGSAIGDVLFAVTHTGQLDPSFTSENKFVNQSLGSVAVTDRGIAVGIPYRYNESFPARGWVMMLRTDGSIDRSFNANGIEPGWIDTVELGVSLPVVSAEPVFAENGDVYFPLGVAIPTNTLPVEPTAAVLRAVRPLWSPASYQPAVATTPAARVGNAHQATGN